MPSRGSGRSSIYAASTLRCCVTVPCPWRRSRGSWTAGLRNRRATERGRASNLPPHPALLHRASILSARLVALALQLRAHQVARLALRFDRQLLRRQGAHARVLRLLEKWLQRLGGVVARSHPRK